MRPSEPRRDEPHLGKPGEPRVMHRPERHCGEPGQPREPRVMLVCCQGGHFMQMLALKSAWGDLPHVWFTTRAADTEALLRDQRAVYAHVPTSRNVKNMFRNLWLAARAIRRHRPDVLLSTGGGVTFPVFVVGKLAGARLIYVESLTRVDGPSLTGRLVYRLVDRFFVQWPEAATRPRMEFVGSLL
jgi:UDP-N-acetylglucosamine:LPS N-acetylglucosamine transferase